jgi:hypothetical protein
MNSDILYYERQRMPWFWAIFLLPINIPFIYGLIKQLILNEPWGNNPMSDTGLIIVSIVIFLFSISMFLVKLETIITQEGIYIRFFPFLIRYRFYSWNEINKVEVKKYSPLKHYGGWGFRFGINGSKAFNMRGRIGLELILNNDRKVLIGTTNPQELEEVISRFRK